MLGEAQIFKDFLKEQRLRWTFQRQIVLEVFLQFDGHVRIPELHEAVLRRDASIGIATVYRTMNLLTECGLVREHDSAGTKGKRFYEKLYRQGHHDHLICLQCGKIVEFEHPLIEKYQLEVCQSHGFTLNHHRMEITGICPECQKSHSTATARKNGG